MLSFPFLDVHAAQTLRCPGAPSQTDVGQIGIEHQPPTFGTLDFHVVFPEFQHVPAASTRLLPDIFRRPASRIHAWTFVQHHLFVLYINYILFSRLRTT
jgi:hypothetical protein